MTGTIGADTSRKRNVALVLATREERESERAQNIPEFPGVLLKKRWKEGQGRLSQLQKGPIESVRF